MSHRPSTIDHRPLMLSGLEAVEITAASNFVNIGERTNVTGSAKFLKLIKEDKFDEALGVALDQVRGVPSAANASYGNCSSRHLISCRHSTSGACSDRNRATCSIRKRTELMFQVATLIMGRR